MSWSLYVEKRLRANKETTPCSENRLMQNRRDHWQWKSRNHRSQTYLDGARGEVYTHQGADQGEAESQAWHGTPRTTNSGLELLVKVRHRVRPPERTAATGSDDTRIAGVEVAGIGDCIVICGMGVMRQDEGRSATE